MAGAYGVAAHLLEFQQSAHPGIGVPHGAQGSCVVMQAHAFEECTLAVQEEAVGAPLGRSDAKYGVLGIAERWMAVGLLPCQFHLGLIERRGLGAPEVGAKNIKATGDREAIGEGDEFILGAYYPAVRETAQGYAEGAFCAVRYAAGGKAEGGGHVHVGQRTGNVSGIYPYAVVRYAGPGGLEQAYVAIDSAARIPAGRFRLVVQVYGYLVCAGMQGGSEVCAP